MIEAEEHREIVAEVAGQQEMFAYELVAGLAHALPLIGVAQQVADAVGGPGRRMHQEARLIVVDLQGDAAARPADHRLALPQRFGHGQSKTFLERLLQHDGRRALQGIDGAMGVGREHQDFQVRVVARTIQDLAEDLGPFGIVVGRSPGQHQLHFRIVGFQQPIGLDNAQRILEPVEPRNLQQQRPFRVDAQPRQRFQPFRFGNRAVLVRQRIDRRQDQEHRTRSGRAKAAIEKIVAS